MIHKKGPDNIDDLLAGFKQKEPTRKPRQQPREKPIEQFREKPSTPKRRKPKSERKTISMDI